jgi:energy-coupling factor transporter ATP-binding protein EcfA2
MYLSRFGVKNYKCLGDIDISLTPIHVLIGENDSGKTSLLEAIQAFYGDMHQPESLFPGPWEGLELVRDQDELKIPLYGEWGEKPEFEKHNPVNVGFDINFYAGCKIRADEYYKVLPDKACLWGDPDFERICKENNLDYSSLRLIENRIWKYRSNAVKYAFEPKILAAPSVSDPARRFRLDADGFGLANLLDDILGNKPERFIELRTAFCKYFPQFASVRVESSKGLRRKYSNDGTVISTDENGKGIFFDTTSGYPIRAQQASDGAILLLGFLALAYLPEPPNLLLIEEPENGIYPKRLEQIITLLKELVTREEGVRFPQIVMTTHSPYLLSYFGPEEVTFLSRPKNDPSGPVRARPLKDAPHIHERMGGEFYLGELWYNLSEEDLFGAE